MKPCSPESGERFLQGLLSEAEASTFVAHLDTCAACQSALEAAAGGEPLWKSAKALRAWPCGGDRDQEPGEFSGHRSIDAGVLPIVDRSSLSFLAPSDDPAMMGRIGPYEIMGVLGRGGFGIVLKGHDRALNRNVAIKVLDPAAASVGAARERFAREARAMAAISHEHVVPVYGVDAHNELPYFVMEYVAGGSLERRLDRDGRFDTIATVRIGLQMAQALAAAHHQGLVHRDIKPGNVLIDRGTERARVTDFGLARIASEVSATKSGFLAGTPQYMAPEQVRGETCDAQSDLFSLGAVMYALCTGHAPFRAETVYGVMQRIVHASPRPIREQNPLVPEWLERFILRLLEKDKSQRFASSDEVAELLQQELAHLQNPAHVRAPDRSWSGPYGAKRRARSRWLAAGVCVALLAAVALAVRRGGDDRGGDSVTESVASTDETSSGESGAALGQDGSSTLLWTVDGTREAREKAEGLRARWHVVDSPRADPWPERLRVLRWRLADMVSEPDG